jgi:hypothetical protein
VASFATSGGVFWPNDASTLWPWPGALYGSPASCTLPVKPIVAYARVGFRDATLSTHQTHTFGVLFELESGALNHRILFVVF